MAAFMIFCRTMEVSPQHYEARVLVVPATDVEQPMATRSESRVFESAELAVSECARMAEAMRMRLCRWGHEVVRVDASGPGVAGLSAPVATGGTRSR